MTNDGGKIRPYHVVFYGTYEASNFFFLTYHHVICIWNFFKYCTFTILPIGFENFLFPLIWAGILCVMVFQFSDAFVEVRFQISFTFQEPSSGSIAGVLKPFLAGEP